jgi:hypothetical protein
VADVGVRETGLGGKGSSREEDAEGGVGVMGLLRMVVDRVGSGDGSSGCRWVRGGWGLGFGAAEVGNDGAQVRRGSRSDRMGIGGGGA